MHIHVSMHIHYNSCLFLCVFISLHIHFYAYPLQCIFILMHIDCNAYSCSCIFIFIHIHLYAYSHPAIALSIYATAQAIRQTDIHRQKTHRRRQTRTDNSYDYRRYYRIKYRLYMATDCRVDSTINFVNACVVVTSDIAKQYFTALHGESSK